MVQHDPSSSITTACTPLWEQSEQTVSLGAQPSVSQLLTFSEQQLLGDYSTLVTEHAGEHARSLSLSLSLSLTHTHEWPVTQDVKYSNQKYTNIL